MNDYTVLPPDDFRIPKRVRVARPKGERPQINETLQALAPDSEQEPAPEPALHLDNPGVLDRRLPQRLHTDTLALCLLEAQGQPIPGPLAYLDNPHVDAPLPLTKADRAKLAMNRGRTTLPPLTWSDVNLRRYLIHLAPLALSPSETSTFADAMSPRIALLLLGGIGIGALEELTERALEVLHFEYELVEPTLNDAMRIVGFGAGERHIHADNVNLQDMESTQGEDPGDYLQRITSNEPPVPTLPFESSRQGIASYYLRHTVGPFAGQAERGDNYRFELLRKVSRHKWWVIARTRELFSLYSDFIPDFSRTQIATANDWMNLTRPGHMEFSLAVRMVFEQPWHKLDLTGDLTKDIVRVMAKLLIYRLSRGSRKGVDGLVTMSARSLVGISLLTGIPTPKFVRFAVEELRRRGETFLTAETVRRAVQLVDESEDIFQYATAGWMDEMHALAMQLEHYQHEPRRLFASMLRKGQRVLGSSNGVYQIKGLDDEGDPIYVKRISRKFAGLTEEM